MVIKMYHISITKRISTGDVIQETLSVNSIEKFEEIIKEIRKKYNELEISQNEMIEEISKELSRVTFEITLFRQKKVEGRIYQMIREFYFFGDDGIVQIIRDMHNQR